LLVWELSLLTAAEKEGEKNGLGMFDSSCWLDGAENSDMLKISREDSRLSRRDEGSSDEMQQTTTKRMLYIVRALFGQNRPVLKGRGAEWGCRSAEWECRSAESRCKLSALFYPFLPL
jgi:hypothetical protein